MPLEPRRASLPALRPILTRYVRSSGLAGLTRTVRLLRSVGPDVFGQGIEYWGSGWHRLEEAGAERFRWVSDDAELVVRCGQRDLCLLVEPGPSLNWRAFDLLIRLAGGETIGKVRVSGLTVARVPVPVLEGGVAALSLAADRKGEPVAGDTRVLNFRVLACACEPAKRETVEVRPSKAWTSVTVGQKPAAIDWPARVHAHRYELAEIGRPAFLHVNACEFILMDRDRWFDLRGLPEADYPPEYLNALFCYTAHFAGITEEVLREPLRIQRASPPAEPRAAMDADLVWLITQMRRLRAPAILTLDTWGAK